ncbi:MAG: fluoride efflux transporter CrcB [Desulfobacterales bacterium]|nr:fluoride efflux transporter CrcB [Desulfobacterales bacterium]MCP4159459.1 fluoride efflux transporter CrcB [Deltaproteobacteria bacterium]
MDKVFLVGIGGFIGASLRYLVSNQVNRLMTHSMFPYGTLFVNILGCFLLGFGLTFAKESGILSENTKLILFTGLLGGFTTYSTFGVESFDLFKNGIVPSGFINLITHIVLGLIAVWIGYFVALKIKLF